MEVTVKVIIPGPCEHPEPNIKCSGAEPPYVPVQTGADVAGIKDVGVGILPADQRRLINRNGGRFSSARR